MSNTFKTWLQNEYEHNTLADMANHGCISGCAHGLIYYYETVKVYEEYKYALHEILQDYKDNFGSWPQYVIDNMGDYTQFANAAVWFCADWIAQEITQGEYVEEA